MRASGARVGAEWTHRLLVIVFFVVLADSRG
jgi:hypothetical protein